MILRRLRWRQCAPGELETVTGRLASWPCEVGGAVRHMFALSAIETYGAEVVRLTSDDERWAACIVFRGRLVVPCGDASAIDEAGPPTRRWRLLVGDADPADAVLTRWQGDPATRIHVQRFLTVEADRVPGEGELGDPGLRRANDEDLAGLARLAVQLHIDDEFGPDPGRSGLRGYAQRLDASIQRGLVFCVGPPGDPIAKLERSVSSWRWGVQLAGIVVAPEARGEGLGRSMVASAVRSALREGPRDRPMSLHVRADNDPAIRAYAAAGFVDREDWRLAVRT